MDLEHLRVLREGRNQWNEWRLENSELMPNLFEADLRRAYLQYVNLLSADLGSANLSGADLQYANLQLADLTKTNLSDSNLRRATLTGAKLIQTNLNRADLRWANLRDSNLSAASFQHANLRGADLRNAYLRAAYMHEADLSGVDLSFANLSDANLSGATFTEAVMGWTTVSNVDLSAVKALDDVKHIGPSSISIDTIYRSRGKISVHFLRGAGVPDNFIEYMSSLVGAAFEFYSCFISYSTIDQKFADRLFADLQKEGVRCWFAPHHIRAGEKLHEQIDAAIRLHERLLLILSPASINSEWVKTEIAKARKREIKEGRRMLFPIRLDVSFEQLQEWECFDADRGKDSAREIREYYIPDFTGWKDHDQYEKEFKKLLRDLKKAASAATP